MCSLCANVSSKSTRTISSAERLCQKSFYQTYRNHTFSSRARLACQVQRTSVGHRDTRIKGDYGNNISYILWKLLSPHHRRVTAQAGQTAWFPSYKSVYWWWISFWTPALDIWQEFLWMKSICDSSTLSLRTVRSTRHFKHKVLTVRHNLIHLRFNLCVTQFLHRVRENHNYFAGYLIKLI